jgi:Uma2 family endonuclease
MLRSTADDVGLVPLTVEQYHRMIEQGILPEGEPIELLDGQLVPKNRSAVGEDPMTVGHGHSWVVTELDTLNSKLRRLGCHMRIQQPISLPPIDEPEPDGAIVIGLNARYRQKHPAAADVLCVIEVADSSLQRDRTQKLRVYAGAGIAKYVIINLFDRAIEVYTNPVKGTAARYRRMETLTGNGRLELPAPRGKKLSVVVRNLLP